MIEKIFAVPADRYEAGIEWIEANLEPTVVVLPAPREWAIFVHLPSDVRAAQFRLFAPGYWQPQGDGLLMTQGVEFGQTLSNVEADARAIIDDMGATVGSNVLVYWVVDCAFTDQGDAARYAAAVGAVQLMKSCADQQARDERSPTGVRK